MFHCHLIWCEILISLTASIFDPHKKRNNNTIKMNKYAASIGSFCLKGGWLFDEENTVYYDGKYN